jgi:hypothetical protein
MRADYLIMVVPFRRTVENKPTAIVVISAESCTRSCASLTLELNGIAGWVRTNDLQTIPARKNNVLPIRSGLPI